MIVYFIEARSSKNQYHNPIKIGMTKDLKSRLVLIQNGNPFHLSCLFYIEVSTKEKARVLEKKYHNLFKKHRMMGEWFEGRIRGWKCFKRLLKNAVVVDPEILKI